MDPIRLLHSLTTHGVETFSRSSGPGGQNVNKVSTKVLLRVSLELLEGLNVDERARVRTALSSRLTPEGELQIQVQDERSQRLNRDLAVERLFGLIERALHRDRPRRATKATRASHERRISAKKIASGHRANRRVSFD